MISFELEICNLPPAAFTSPFSPVPSEIALPVIVPLELMFPLAVI